MNLRILTYNINKSRDWLFRKSSREIIKKFILDVDADIVFLQEFFGEEEKGRVIGNELESFADEIWKHFVYAKNSVYEGGHHGNAILSKFPILNWENLDISTNRFEKRGILYVKVLIPTVGNKQELDLYCVHLDLLQTGRNKQMAQIVKEVPKRSQQTPYIIAGDFNDWNSKLDKEIKKKLNVLECGAASNNDKVKKTFPSLFPLLPLDRVYVNGISPDKTFSYHVRHYPLLSDHLPLLVQASLGK